MLMKRIIPCLDIKGGRVVKGIRFLNLRDAGDPAELAAAYMREGADEIVFLDISASAERRRTLSDWVRSVADQLFIPFTVGGGISEAGQAREIVALGADKISLNTAAVRNPDLIRDCARTLGRQAVVLAIDAKRNAEGRWDVLIEGGRTPTGLDVVEWAREGVRLGCGEILLTSMDRDGTNQGYDLDLIRAVSEAAPVPLVASGGAGSSEDMRLAFAAGADAALAASIFHYGLLGIGQVKSDLANAGIPIRIEDKEEKSR
ncbi:MAG: imidazole glycerol phosphate synthase subunit HisF [Synergistales bacterium]